MHNAEMITGSSRMCFASRSKKLVLKYPLRHPLSESGMHSAARECLELPFARHARGLHSVRDPLPKERHGRKNPQTG